LICLYSGGNTDRLHGSYEALIGGVAAEAMEDFTGDVVETYNLLKELDFDLFNKSMGRQSLISCSIENVKSQQDYPMV